MNTTIKKSVLAALVAGGMVMGVSAAEDQLTLDGSTTVGPIAKAFAEYMMRQDSKINITVSESGSGNGAKALLNGACDIANLSRSLKDSEKEAMKAKGIKPVAHVAAYDALPVIVHPSNKVSELTIEQIKDIYTGKITNWKDVGGFDSTIVVISRDTNSGTYESFAELVLGKEGKVVQTAEYTGSNGAVRQRVQKTGGAIGYIGIGFIDDSTKVLKVNGVEPSIETVLDKTYPICRELFMFTNGEPTVGSLASRFLGLISTKDGNRIIDEIGFVPVGTKK